MASSPLDPEIDDGSATDDEEAVTVDIKPEVFRWNCENYSQLVANHKTSPKHFSPEWVSSAFNCRWRLLMFANGNPGDRNAFGRQLSLYLDVPDREELPNGWQRSAKFWLCVINQKDRSLDQKMEAQIDLNTHTPDYGFPSLLSLEKINDPESGFLVDDTLMIEAELVVQRVWTDRALSYSNWSANSRKDLGYVGLRNQGATCYLNSLMQGLFHIGAFRRAVYMMNTEKDDVAKSIPLALQRLFFRMQFENEAPGTKELTRSFGWSDYESFKQHDVQELNRVLMDNLETKMKGTPVQMADGYIENLFKGQMENFIQCENVPFKSSRPEDFYDISLVVKGLKDIYESIDAYVAVETLDGANKYHAEEYGLQTAKKGVRFLKFPPVLNIQLKRWDYHPTTWMPYKVNDLYMFYPILDLSKYLDRTVNHESGIYHLHAVLVHSGGVGGGHYYAYARPSSRNKWYKFNDQMVSAASEKEAINDNWGGDETVRYTRYGVLETHTVARSANAYMLIYVRETESYAYMNDDCADVIPDHLRSAADEHLLVDLKIAMLKDLHAHDQSTFDLITTANIQPQRHKKTESINAFKARAAIVFDIPVERQQYWVWTKRQNGTIRPLRTLTAKELAHELNFVKPLQAYSHEYHPILLLVDADPDPATGVAPFIDESANSDVALVFFKFYDPAASKVTYVGHACVSISNDNFETLEQRFREQAGDLVPAGAKLNAWEEICTKNICPVVPNNFTFKDAELQTGDVYIFMIEQPQDAPAYPHPTPAEWYPYIADRLKVEFRNLNAPDDKEQYFSLECRKSFVYADVQAVVGKQIDADPAKIRFTGISPTMMAPRHQPCERNQDLPGMIRWFANYVTPDILYYEVLTARLDEIEKMKKIKIEYQTANLKPLKLINLWVPRQGTVRDIFPLLQEVKEVREVLESDPAEGRTTGTKTFRLMEVWNCKVGKVWEGASPLLRIDEIAKYVVQETDPEEATFNGDTHLFLSVAHYTISAHNSIQTHGSPFFMVVAKTELFSSIKARLQKKLMIPDEEFAKWKVSFCSYYRAQVLEDDQSFESLNLRIDPYTSFLGLEHPDTTVRPTYSSTYSSTMYPSHQSREAGIVIKN